MSDKKVIITITGPSTSGKSTLAELFKPEGFQEVVSTTTRPQRTGEINGISYYFVDDNKFSEMMRAEELVEHAAVGQYSYGVSKRAISDVLNAGKPAVLVIEPKGANNVAKFCEQEGITVHKVFLNNDMNILIDRLQKRWDEDAKAKEEVYKERLWNIAFIEPKEWTAKAYSGEHHYDQIFDSFLPENQDEVLHSILSAVEQKLTKKNNSRLKP